MLWSSALSLSLLAVSVNANRWDDFAEKHSWQSIPKGWNFHSHPSPDHRFDLTLGLKKSNIEGLVKSLYQVSDPSHESYGKHLSKESVHTLVSPAASTLSAVQSWLAHHGITLDSSDSISGHWLTIPSITISQAERMLNTKYGVYHHPESEEYVVRAMSYSLPRELHEHVKVVSPTTYFSTLKSMRVTSFLQPEIKPVEVGVIKTAKTQPGVQAVVPTSCNTVITPSCLQALYNTTGYVPQATDRNTLGVAGYLKQFANRADLKTFAQRFRTDAVNATYTTILLNGGQDDQSQPGVEANLDIQYTIGMSFPTPNIYYSTGGSPPFNPDSQTPTNTNEPYIDWLKAVLANDTVPQTITTSYGDDEQTVPRDYAEAVCEQFVELGARGSTVLFSSGDFGVGGGDCKTNDGKNTTLFQPAFPASCPFVTAVGGTTRVNPEVAVSFSGGGFSRYFSRPDYQNASVSTFLTGLGTKFAGLYNATGRAYPDLAAQGSGFQVVIGGRTSSVGGTSASSPTVAGIIALLNDVRISAGKPSLGFLNPLIYAHPEGFNDILSGSNPGCGTTGFTAGRGWDPVTGLGTPDFLKFVPIVNTTTAA